MTNQPAQNPHADFTDDVTGIIIGGDHVQWELLYDGRQQATGYADSDEEAIAAAKLERDQLKWVMNPVGLLTGSFWEVRLRP